MFTGQVEGSKEWGACDWQRMGQDGMKGRVRGPEEDGLLCDPM